MSDFYAVKAGVKPGIYLTWKECENNTKGFPNARYKKFSSKDLALQFINESNFQTEKKQNVPKILKNLKRNNKSKYNTTMRLIFYFFLIEWIKCILRIVIFIALYYKYF